MSDSKLTIKVSFNHKSYFTISKHSAKTTIKKATICRDILEMAIRGELVTNDGKNYFER